MHHGIHLIRACEFLTELSWFGHLICLAITFAIISMLDYFVSYVEFELPPMHKVIVRNVCYTVIIFSVIFLFAHAYVAIVHGISG
jgi:uncharacterized membrane protein